MHALRNLARRSSRAQALAEFALVLPIIILLLAMAIDLGRVFYGWVSIQNAARVGASYAASNADAWESPADATRQTRYATLIQNDLQALNCALGAVPPPAFDDLDADGTYDTGEPVAVALDCEFSLITPIGQTILGPVNLGGEATYPVHYTVVTALPSPPPPPPPPTCTVPGTVGQSPEHRAKPVDRSELPVRQFDRDHERQLHSRHPEPDGGGVDSVHLIHDDFPGGRTDADSGGMHQAGGPVQPARRQSVSRR